MRKFSKSQIIFIAIAVSIILLFIFLVVFLGQDFDKASIFPSHDKTLMIWNLTFG